MLIKRISAFLVALCAVMLMFQPSASADLVVSSDSLALEDLVMVAEMGDFSGTAYVHTQGFPVSDFQLNWRALDTSVDIFTGSAMSLTGSLSVGTITDSPVSFNSSASTSVMGVQMGAHNSYSIFDGSSLTTLDLNHSLKMGGVTVDSNASYELGAEDADMKLHATANLFGVAVATDTSASLNEGLGETVLTVGYDTEFAGMAIGLLSQALLSDLASFDTTLTAEFGGEIYGVGVSFSNSMEMDVLDMSFGALSTNVSTSMTLHYGEQPILLTTSSSLDFETFSLQEVQVLLSTTFAL